MPWLPVPREHRALAVERQEADPHSVLNGFRTFMHWRRSQPVLRWGDIHFLDTAEPVLACTRPLAGQTMLVAFNLADTAAELTVPATLGKPVVAGGHGLLQGHLVGGQLHLPGYGAWFAHLA